MGRIEEGASCACSFVEPTGCLISVNFTKRKGVASTLKTGK
jgi:hypothetical protein